MPASDTSHGCTHISPVLRRDAPAPSPRYRQTVERKVQPQTPLKGTLTKRDCLRLLMPQREHIDFMLATALFVKSYRPDRKGVVTDALASTGNDRSQCSQASYITANLAIATPSLEDG
ncbi:unnamed protein product, partial [Trichogramma brassicae]